MKKRPNIVIFNPDQMRYDALGHMGVNPGAETPFLDEMIREDAVSYRYAFCQNPVCTPSRCSFLPDCIPMYTDTGPCVICCTATRVLCSAS